MKIDTIIIGGGISGLYTGYKLINSGYSSDKKIALFEKSSRIGGRLYTQITANNRPINLGAGRFDRRVHTLLRDLIDELEIETCGFVYSKMNSDSGHSDNITRHFKNIIMSNSLSNCDQSFADVVVQNYGINYFNELVNDFGYDVLKREDLPFLQAAKILLEHPESRTTSDHEIAHVNWLQIKKGFQSIAEKLHTILADNNICAYFNHELISLSKENNKYNLQILSNGKIKTYYANNVILAIPKNDFEILDCNLPSVKTRYNAVSTVSLFKMFFIFSEAWWKEIFPNNYYLTTSSPIRRIYFSAINKELFVYCDSCAADYWNNILLTKGKSHVIKLALDQIAEVIKIPSKECMAPIEFHHQYWPYGVSFWNTTLNDSYCKLSVTRNLSQVYFVSDMYSENPGWIEGALQSATLAVNTLIKQEVNEPIQI